MKNVSFKKKTIFKSTENRSMLSSGTSNAIYNCRSLIVNQRKYEPGKVVLPLGLQVEPGGLEGVGLLLHRVPHHFPETLGNGEAQVSGRDRGRVDDAAPGNEKSGQKYRLDSCSFFC